MARNDLVTVRGGPFMMSEQTRRLIFRTIDDTQTPEMLHLMQGLYNFTRCDEILVWMLNNGFRGYPLLNWFKHEWKGSLFGMVKYVLGRIDQTKKEAIMHGKDWVDR